MRWPWQQHVYPDRATLTLLPPIDGEPQAILGVPETLTQEQVHRIAVFMREWMDQPDRRLVIFPFPVDVIDKR